MTKNDFRLTSIVKIILSFSFSLVLWENTEFLPKKCLFTFGVFYLKVQSCKLYNNKYMIASTQIRNTETLRIHSCSSF